MKAAYTFLPLSKYFSIIKGGAQKLPDLRMKYKHVHTSQFFILLLCLTHDMGDLLLHSFKDNILLMSTSIVNTLIQTILEALVYSLQHVDRYIGYFSSDGVL